MDEHIKVSVWMGPEARSRRLQTNNIEDVFRNFLATCMYTCTLESMTFISFWRLRLKNICVLFIFNRVY